MRQVEVFSLYRWYNDETFNWKWFRQNTNQQSCEIKKNETKLLTQMKSLTIKRTLVLLSAH